MAAEAGNEPGTSFRRKMIFLAVAVVLGLAYLLRGVLVPLFLAFLLAYAVRFESGLIAITKGHPPLGQYLRVVPFSALVVLLAFQLQGVYRVRRGRSRVDDFFAVLVGSILAVVLGVVSTLYFQAYYVADALKDSGAYEVSQIVWALFLVFNVGLAYAVREVGRQTAERRWRQVSA